MSGKNLRTKVSKATVPEVVDITSPETVAVASKPTTSLEYTGPLEHASGKTSGDKTVPQSHDGGMKKTAPQTISGSNPLKNFSTEQVEEFKEAFDLFDKRGEGKIRIVDVDTAMRALGKNPSVQEVRDMAKNFDTAGSGKIGFQDFMALISSQTQEDEQEDELMETFKTLDRTGQGLISANELRYVMATFGETLTDEELDELIREADSDGDGLKNYEDYKVTFDILDKTGEEKIRIDDVDEAMRAHGIIPSVHEIKDMGRKMDVDGSGKIGLEDNNPSAIKRGVNEKFQKT